MAPRFHVITALAVIFPAVVLGKGKEPQVYAPAVPVHSGGKQTAQTQTCPQGYYFQDGKCVTKQEVPEAFFCPAGSVEQQGQCLIHTPPRFVCPKGLTLQGNECVGEEVIQKVNQCPSGATPSGRDCVIHINEVATCPAGTASDGSRCAKLMPMVKACPAGFSPRGDLCAAQEYEQLLTVCPNGTYDDGNVCRAVYTQEEKCPEGTVDIGNSCASYTSKIWECPNGYSKAGNTCIRTETAPKNAICPNGADPNNNCLVKVPVPPSPFCKVGKLVNGQCYKPLRVAPSFTCPSGYTLNRGSTCAKTVTFDCSETHHDIECEQVPTGKSGSHVRMLGVDAKGKYQSVAYNKRQPNAAPLPVCHKVPRTKPKTCEKTITAQAETVCNTAGSVLKGSYCEVDEYFAPEYRCNAQSSSGGSKGVADCYVEETTAVIRSCPAGFSNTGSNCRRTESASPNYFCPPGTEEPNCATYQPKRCPGGNCEGVHTERPQVMCPEGYHMLESGAHQHRGAKNDHLCTKTVYADKVPSCPAGTAVYDAAGMTCATFVDKIAGSRDKRVPMQHLCPQGYSESSNKCHRRIVEPAAPTCADGGQQFDGQGCAKPVPMNSDCPKGAVQDKGKCWAFSTTQPISVETVVSAGGGHGGKGY